MSLEIWTEGVSCGLGNPVRGGGGGSVKNAHHLLVGVVDFFWSNPMSKVPWILLLYEEF